MCIIFVLLLQNTNFCPRKGRVANTWSGGLTSKDLKSFFSFCANQANHVGQRLSAAWYNNFLSGNCSDRVWPRIECLKGKEVSSSSGVLWVLAYVYSPTEVYLYLALCPNIERKVSRFPYQCYFHMSRYCHVQIIRQIEQIIRHNKPAKRKRKSSG